MSVLADEYPTHIESTDVDCKIVENGPKVEGSRESGTGVNDAYTVTYLIVDAEAAPLKNPVKIEDVPAEVGQTCINLDDNRNTSITSVEPVSTDERLNIVSREYYFPKNRLTKEQATNLSNTSCNTDVILNNGPEPCETDSEHLHSSTISLDDQIPLVDKTNINCWLLDSMYSGNLNFADKEIKSDTNIYEKEINREQILSEFTSHKTKMAAVQKIPETTVDLKYPRIPKEILSQDIGSIVKNVHGIFSSVSGSLKSAYSHRTAQRPVKIAPVVNSKATIHINEDDIVKTETGYESIAITETKINQEDSEPKLEVLKVQIETLERVLTEQRKENVALQERVKQDNDELQAKDQMLKEMENKLDLMGKRAEQAEREKDAAVMRYASVECAKIEARRAADASAKAEKAAHAEMELLNGKLRSAHAEKQRICQMYDDKCHELMNSERELARVRDEIREVEGRLKWTQSKLRMEADAYKESAERAEKLSLQVVELETARGACAASATEAARIKHLEGELEECRAALIMCRHEREELQKRYSSTAQQLDACTRERDAAKEALTRATREVLRLSESNARLEEEAAELAALRAQAALADSLSAQLNRESERAARAEEALGVERACAETRARREAAALEHAAALTAHHVAHRAAVQRADAAAQALAADNASLRERIAALEASCASLEAALADETDKRNKENRVLARKVAELTEEAAEANKQLDWEKGENGILRKKHASAIKELSREMQRALKRCEQLEAKAAQGGGHSAGTGSITSLSSSEGPQHEDRIPNGHADNALPEVQAGAVPVGAVSAVGAVGAGAAAGPLGPVAPDRQALVERIVALQRAAARRAERCDFLEEHSRQLTAELRAKSRLLRALLARLPAGAADTPPMDRNKKEIARLGGGAMAALWGGDSGGITLDLSLEMNKRLQAVLEDTLLKNITLKENIDTLGAEISKLKEQNNSNTDSK